MSRFAALKWKLVAKQRCCFYVVCDSLASAAAGGRDEMWGIKITNPPAPCFFLSAYLYLVRVQSVVQSVKNFSNKHEVCDSAKQMFKTFTTNTGTAGPTHAGPEVDSLKPCLMCGSQGCHAFKSPWMWWKEMNGWGLWLRPHVLNTSQGRQETEDPGVGFGDDECHGNNGCLCGSTWVNWCCCTYGYVFPCSLLNFLNLLL